MIEAGDEACFHWVDTARKDDWDRTCRGLGCGCRWRTNSSNYANPELDKFVGKRGQAIETRCPAVLNRNVTVSSEAAATNCRGSGPQGPPAAALGLRAAKPQRSPAARKILVVS